MRDQADVRRLPDVLLRFFPEVGDVHPEVAVTTPYDEGHPHVAGGPAWLSTTVKHTPGGDVMVFTLRVPNSTTTAVLAKADAEAWLKQFADNVAAMSSIVIAPAGAALPQMGVNGHHPS